MSSLTQSSLGSIQQALEIARRAADVVPAYHRLLAEKSASTDGPFENLPVTDKAGYLKQNCWPDLVGDDFADTFHVFGSSGSSGRPFYWPQLKTSLVAAHDITRLLEAAFGIHQRRTLAVVGLALGSWIGGDFFSWLLKSIALKTPYPFAVFSPGNKHEEIIAMLRAAAPLVDQFLLVCCPSAIGHLILRAEEAGTPLPLEKMRYLVLGEPFPEALRLSLQQRAQLPPGTPLMLSVYGSADTGVLGFESPLSVGLRQLASAQPAIAAELELDRVIPHFFHQIDPAAYLESFNGELCVTKWQGIPLVRYNLHDSVRLYQWPSIAMRFAEWAARFPVLAPALQAMQSPLPLSLPGLLAITGRADSCLILCGTNLSESMLDEAVHTPELKPILTGAYQARLLLEDGRQRLGFTLEYRPEHGAPADVVEKVYPLLIESLGRVQPEFRDDWVSIYHTWDDQPAQRILKLELLPWPELSRAGEGRIKQRGIVA